MSKRIAITAIFGTALFLASALTASAQSLGVGLSFLGDNLGTGLQADYAVPFNTTRTDKAVELVGDFSFYHNGEGNFLANVSVNTLMIQVGGRIIGKASDKVTWLGQGLVGYRHFGFGGSITACDLPGVDCGDNGGVLTVGGGLVYDLSDKAGVKAQLDFPIPIGGSGDTTTRFTIAYVMKLGK